ncbi:PAS domain-containing protein [candidate division TA06 bacterium]|nr:PAS domain-containing protein [candidate division TA06 bacterium]
MFDRMNDQMVKALLETVPYELTVIDHNDEVIGWNQHETRLFKRPMGSMGMNFRQCHPQSSLAKVEAIVNEFKEKKRDKARFWIQLPLGPGGQKQMILIEFFALRDETGKYLGCLECTRNVEDIRQLQGEQRLMS